MGSGDKEVNRRIVSGRAPGQPMGDSRQGLSILSSILWYARIADKLDVLLVNLHTRTVLD
jgi:hypothetical protein